VRVRANYIIISFRFHYLLAQIDSVNLDEKADELFDEQKLQKIDKACITSLLGEFKYAVEILSMVFSYLPAP
jgi:hypothetical protein